MMIAYELLLIKIEMRKSSEAEWERNASKPLDGIQEWWNAFQSN